MGDGFEEEFGALGGVDAIVEVAAAGIFGFGDAGAAAVVVGDTGGPDLLVADGSKQRRVEEMIGRRSVNDLGFEMSEKIVVGHESVERGLFEWVRVIFVMDEESFGGAVEYQGVGPSLVS
jgi:hypothetical protein